MCIELEDQLTSIANQKGAVSASHWLWCQTHKAIDVFVFTAETNGLTTQIRLALRNRLINALCKAL